MEAINLPQYLTLLKKPREKFPYTVFKEIRKGPVAKSYLRKDFLKYEGMEILVIYFVVPVIFIYIDIHLHPILPDPC